MKLDYKILKNPSIKELKLIQKWKNNTKIKHLTTVHRSSDDLKKRTLLANIIEEYAENQDTTRYLIILDEKPIGEINYQWNSRHLFKKHDKTAWTGIMIGKDDVRGKGLGTLALKYLEKQITKQDANRIELGVFAFNKPALNLYFKMGYRKIGRIPNLTYWNGKLWDSIQLEKNL